MSYFKGETVTFSIEIRKESILFDPSSLSISISKNAVIKINEQPMIKTSAGMYYFDWATDEQGTFKVIYKAMDGQMVTFKKDILKVI